MVSKFLLGTAKAKNTYDDNKKYAYSTYDNTRRIYNNIKNKIIDKQIPLLLKINIIMFTNIQIRY